MAMFTGSTALLAGGALGLNFLGAKTQADASKTAANQQVAMQMEALKRDQERYEQSRQIMQPYVNYGNMGLERMLGTGPMTQTMGGGAQYLARQQTPTLTERTKKYLGEEFTNEMFGELLGESGQGSPEDWMTGKRKNQIRRHPRFPWLTKNMGRQEQGSPTRPWTEWQYSPDSSMSDYMNIPGRAFGGPVRSSQPYMVGEHGPEIMVPQQGGTVIPNRAGNMLAGLGQAQGSPYQQQGQPTIPGMPMLGTQGPSPVIGGDTATPGPMQGQPIQRGGPRGQAFAANAAAMHQAALAAGRGGPRSRGLYGQRTGPMQGQPSMPGAPYQSGSMQPGAPYQSGSMQMGQPSMPGMPGGQIPGGRPMQFAQAISAAGGQGRPRKIADFMLNWGGQSRALGGPVNPNNPYMVGETGPEMVVPNKPKNLGQQAISKRVNQLGQWMNPTGYAESKRKRQEQDYGTYQGVQPGNYIADQMQRPEYANNPTGSPLYTLDPGMQSFMDWEAMNNQPPTAPQPGILEQGPPDPGQAPTRTPFDFQAYQDSPWYQQPLQQGIDAIQRSAIGQGNLYSGGTMEALNKFGQDYAFSKYMPARQQELGESESDFNRWLQSGQFGLSNWLQGTLQPTQEMIRIGQNSAAGQASNALQNSQYQGNLLSNIGSAQGSSTLGYGSAYSGMYNNFGNMLAGLGGYGLMGGMN